MSAAAGTVTTLNVAPGSVVRVRDEDWLVTGVDQTADGPLITVQGLSELVRDTTAMFYDSLDTIVPFDPSATTVKADASSEYRRARLWLESTLRKTAIPLDDDSLTVADAALADPLEYQRIAVRKALDTSNLRPRVLLADAVGLGKTLEIGMILSELVRRGRGDRILIVTPRHVLEQMQHEMWSRFALPFIRLDSQGIQRIRQKLPATRNAFAFYKRVIISIDTLKSEKYIQHLRKQRWDAVVIDESHNITNSSAQNNRLARILAPNTEALILASATPHNGKAESFAELIRLLEPTAVAPDGKVIEDEVKRLVVRRHRNSPEVAKVVGGAWAPRKEPVNRLVQASPVEDAIATELSDTWLHPSSGSAPGASNSLFPWTLAKAFLSSPAALTATVTERLKRIKPASGHTNPEKEALERLLTLSTTAVSGTSAKYDALLDELHRIGVAKGTPERAVIFAERVPTLHWLRDRLRKDLKMSADQVQVLHGGLTDVEQMAIIESFKQASSDIRVLVTGDVASEGVNLHLQCHELIHFDIPWSLIRIEQRNGRIDRYGQRHSPQITSLLLEPTSGHFSGDVRVLTKLIEKEHEAHSALGDAASLMGKYDVEAEEKAIRSVLAGDVALETVVHDADQVASQGTVAGLFARLNKSASASATPSAGIVQTGPQAGSTGLYPDDLSFLRDALTESYASPAHALPGGVGWSEHPTHSLVELTPPPDLARRLEDLPQSYLSERKVTERFMLAVTKARGKETLARALQDEGSTWPEAHYLGALHPVLDWAADRALASLDRDSVFAVRGPVDHPTVLLVGTLTNRRGQMVASSFASVEFPNPTNTDFALQTQFSSSAEMLASVGLHERRSNHGAVAGVDALTALVAPAVRAAQVEMEQLFAAASDSAAQRVDQWSHRLSTWEDEADALIQRSDLKVRRVSVEKERELVEQMAPSQRLVRPLVVLVPLDHAVESNEGTN
ncbi:SNF2-related protein [Sanguibacter suaedae]|uniref:DEAD/DEAH box helicase family protein n=1 Tax=Sanguibacter suaedae TaxID=2795737 RepID=A0A934IAP1_9MICO|nr:helicase-related protein [Sanguibacter suaedae]MBI9114982.1 DEAD/DEAH box helicase family protein [Sanguibacter suaedae]